MHCCGVLSLAAVGDLWETAIEDFITKKVPTRKLLNVPHGQAVERAALPGGGCAKAGLRPEQGSTWSSMHITRPRSG